MDNQQAKFILESYQPGSTASLDAPTTEALARVQNDEELRAWFMAEQADDAFVREKLAQVPVPAHLRARLLAAPLEVEPARTIPWRPLLALAASIVFLLGLVWWKPFARPQPEFAAYRLQMVETLYRPITFEFRSVHPLELQTWLADHASLGPITVPPSLSGLPGLGCRTLDCGGHPAAVICFLTSEKRAVHLFVLAAQGIDHRLGPTPQLKAVGLFQTASWVEGDLVYMLAGSGDAESLRRLLARGEVAMLTKRLRCRHEGIPKGLDLSAQGWRLRRA